MDQMDHPAALHRLKVGVPATVEHSSEAGPETGKWVAETTQVCLALTAILTRYLILPAELHHLHGCAQVAHACEGPAAPNPAGARDRLRTFQRQQGLGRQEQDGQLVSILPPPPTKVTIMHASLQAHHAQRHEGIRGDYRGTIKTGECYECCCNLLLADGRLCV